jgi:hypothetical protein
MGGQERANKESNRSNEEEDTCMSYGRRIHACHMGGGYMHVIWEEDTCKDGEQ